MDFINYQRGKLGLDFYIKEFDGVNKKIIRKYDFFKKLKYYE